MFSCLALIAAFIGPGTESYLKLMSQHPHLSVKGDASKGEIELVLDPIAIAEVEEKQAARWVKKGIDAEDARASSRVGIVAEDPYWIWIRDAVLFPSGTYGTYERIFWKCSLERGVGGVAVLPILPDGRILLNLNFRHATRSWEWELPRGAVERGEGIEEAARREVAEETGWLGGDLELLGSMSRDAGTLGSVVPVYACKLIEEGSPERDESEAIQGAYPFTIDEINRGLREGKLNGSPLRDAFLTYALYQVYYAHQGKQCSIDLKSELESSR